MADGLSCAVHLPLSGTSRALQLLGLCLDLHLEHRLCAVWQSLCSYSVCICACVSSEAQFLTHLRPHDFSRLYLATHNIQAFLTELQQHPS